MLKPFKPHDIAMLAFFFIMMSLMFAFPIVPVLIGIYACLTLAALFWMYIDRRYPTDKARVSIGKSIVYIIGGFIVALAIQIVGLQLTMFLTGADSTAVSNADEVKSAIDRSKLFILVVIISAPIFEEVIFRGILFRRLADRGYFWPAITFSSLFFAVAHLQELAILVFLLLGLLLAYLYHVTNRLIVPMAVHFLNNGMALLGLLLTNQL